MPATNQWNVTSLPLCHSSRSQVRIQVHRYMSLTRVLSWRRAVTINNCKKHFFMSFVLQNGQGMTHIHPTKFYLYFSLGRYMVHHASAFLFCFIRRSLSYRRAWCTDMWIPDPQVQGFPYAILVFQVWHHKYNEAFLFLFWFMFFFLLKPVHLKTGFTQLAHLINCSDSKCLMLSLKFVLYRRQPVKANFLGELNCPCCTLHNDIHTVSGIINTLKIFFSYFGWHMLS